MGQIPVLTHIAVRTQHFVDLVLAWQRQARPETRWQWRKILNAFLVDIVRMRASKRIGSRARENGLVSDEELDPLNSMFLYDHRRRRTESGI